MQHFRNKKGAIDRFPLVDGLFCVFLRPKYDKMKSDIKKILRKSLNARNILAFFVTLSYHNRNRLDAKTTRLEDMNLHRPAYCRIT
jgi:hypothetical protein